MEGDICVENVRAVNESGEVVKVSALVVDEDSSAIAHAWSQVDSTVENWSDVIHVKKAWGTSFMSWRRLTRNRPKLL